LTSTSSAPGEQWDNCLARDRDEREEMKGRERGDEAGMDGEGELKDWVTDKSKPFPSLIF
jgi:hypothetical protein